MSTRDRMLDAAAHVMRTRGLARATTKEIAKAAGYSEAALYKHFRDKTDLFLAVLGERMPSPLAAVLGTLGERVGTGSVEETLSDVARAAIAFYRHGFPMAASLFAEPQLFAAYRDALHARGAGPQHVSLALSDYLAAEQEQGRVRADADPAAAAGLLIGGCLNHAFLSHFTDDTTDDNALAATLVRTLATGLLP
jgi:AcrR family transcriptional regulator